MDPNYTIQLVANPVGGTGGLVAGDVVVYDASTQSYLKATTANRGTKRSSGVTRGSASALGAVVIQTVGDIPPSVSGLGTGAEGPVRVSTTGRLERVPTPGAGDDVCGWSEADGTVHLGFGWLTYRVFTGGGGATSPGGSNGDLQVNSAGSFGGLTPPAGNLVGDSATQTLTNKTIVAASNTITDTSAVAGDLLKHNGTRFVRMARGSTGQALVATGSDLAYSSNPAVAAQAMGALNIDWSAGPVHTKTLGAGANSITFSNASSGMSITVRLTGAASTVSWPAGTRWAGGVSPTQTASGTDIYTFVHDGTNIFGSVVQAMA